MAQATENPTTSRYPDPIKTRRRQTLRLLILPFIGGIGVIVVLLLLLVPLRPDQLSLVANLALTCMCLFPLTLCMFPIYMGLVVSVYGLSRADGVLTNQTRRLRGATESLADRTQSAADGLNRQAVGFNSRVAPLERIFSIFDEPNGEDDGRRDDTPESH